MIQASEHERAEQEVIISDHLFDHRFYKTVPECGGCHSVVVHCREVDIIAPELYAAGRRYCLINDAEGLACPECLAKYVAGEAIDGVFTDGGDNR